MQTNKRSGFRWGFSLLVISFSWGVFAVTLLTAQSDGSGPQPPGDVLPGSDGLAPLDVVAPAIPPEAMADPALDTAFALAAIDYSTRPGVTYFIEEAGRTVDVEAGAGVIYVQTRDKVSGQLLPGRALIVVVVRVDGAWVVRFPGDDGYTASFDLFPPGLLPLIDPTPYEAAAVGDVAPQDVNDYALPWAHNQWATVSRSYNYHGTGQIDFVLDGSDIAAAKSGTIIYVNDSNTINTYASGAWWYWNVVVIQHSASEYSTYGHLTVNSVPAWIKAQCTRNYATRNCAVPIRAGEIIGKQGNTGYSSGPHLHMSFGRTFVIETRFAVPTAYSWTLQNVGFTGYSLSQAINWPPGQRLRAQHVNQPRNPAVVANQNLVRSGDFSTGATLTPWTVSSGAAYTVANGVLNLRRTGDPAAVLSQELPYEVAANLPFEVAVQLGSAAEAKQVTVTLDGGPDSAGSLTCTASIAANSPLQTFLLRGRNGAAWTTMRVRLTVQTIGGGNVLVDSVSVRQRTDLAPTATTCFFQPTVTGPTGTITTPFGDPALTWTHVPEAASYDVRVYGSDSSGAPYYQLNGLAASAYCAGSGCRIEPTTQPQPNEAHRLVNGPYTVEVRSNLSGEWSLPVTFTLSAPAAQPPTLDAPIATDTLRPTFRWSLQGSAVYVTHIQVNVIEKTRYDAGNFTPALNATYPRADLCGGLGGTTCSLIMPSDLIDDTDYYVFVRGRGPGGYSAGGNYGGGYNGVTFRIDTIADAGVPTTVTATGEDGHPIVRWDDDPTADSYRVRLINTGSGEIVYLEYQQKGDAVTCDGAGCVFMPTLDLVNGTYAASVSACGAGGCSTGGPNGDGWGGGDANATFTLAFPAPALVSDLAATPDSGNVIVTWTGTPGATWYVVWAGRLDPADTLFQERYSSVALGCRVPGTPCEVLLPLGLAGETIYVAVQSNGPGGALASGGQTDNGYQVSEAVVMP